MNHSKNPQRYAHIIHYEYPYPTHRKKMSMINRGAQFEPFAALTGYDSAILETSRLTDKQIELSQEDIDTINRNLNYIQELLPDCPPVMITYFVKDDKKEGGTYITKECHIKKVDEYERCIVLTNKEKILIENISEIFGSLFDVFFE